MSVFHIPAKYAERRVMEEESCETVLVINKEFLLKS
jgi:hypothetical protein